MLHILRMLVVGLIIGILARFFYPGTVHINWLWSALLGIAGSFVGGLMARAFTNEASDQPIQPAGCLMSIIGAMVLIFICRSLLHII
ncbi:GlsB/YeaQ/YmgE family stress response membrane protein [Flavisphingomonas formosensis]|uniref:GlsB/YeaQ/YmgE family stress response membrane protein n=1 Tax=Flavisphingomonas formosensis TaxID=861534 RepID=UPI0012F9D42B|nr:GlsB/YeaQ/YmgE family stress response membrane protein [Sphingomonas formosensis]